MFDYVQSEADSCWTRLVQFVGGVVPEEPDLVQCLSLVVADETIFRQTVDFPLEIITA